MSFASLTSDSLPPRRSIVKDVKARFWLVDGDTPWAYFCAHGAAGGWISNKLRLPKKPGTCSCPFYFLQLVPLPLFNALPLAPRRHNYSASTAGICEQKKSWWPSRSIIGVLNAWTHGECLGLAHHIIQCSAEAIILKCHERIFLTARR